MSNRERRWTAGLILIAVGLAFLVLQRLEGAGSSTLILVLGAIFLVGYLVRRAYGLLIPAGILLGIGLGDLLEAPFVDDEGTFGLGCGFLFIYGVAALIEKRTHWWPLVPGVLLVLIGFNDMRSVTDLVLTYWPLALVGAGLLVLFGVIGGGRRSGAG